MGRRTIICALIAAGSSSLAFALTPQASTSRTAAALHAFPAVLADDPIIDFEFASVTGKSGWLSEQKGKAYVIVVRDAACPVSQRYGRRVARMEQEYGARGVVFVYVNLNATDVPAEDIQRFGFAAPYVHDAAGRIGRLLGVRSTGDVFLLDAQRKLVYRGPLDDQYGISFTRPQPKQEYVRRTLDDLLANKSVKPRKQDAEGCLLGFDTAARIDTPVTYHARVSRIIQNNCQTCHRADGIAPFALEKYEDVYARRQMIAFMVRNRRMPPWFAHRDVGEFANDRSLPDDDLTDLIRWVDNGAPAGNAKDAPPPRQWADGWQIGKPDAVVAMEEPFALPAEGVVEYQYFYVKTDFPEDRWVERMELRPGARRQVHHALVFIEEPGRARNPRDRKPGDPPFQGGASGFFAAYAPGYPGLVFPEGTAKKLPKGAWLKFQMHYTTNGVAATDLTQLGFVFAKQPPQREVETRSALNADFVIPPGAANHEVVGERVFRTAGTLVSLFPHMHVRGKAFRIELVLPDNTVKPLLSVPRYDFNWQLLYVLKEPIHVPAGARLRATAWYDNSASHPGNPDPTKSVRWGEQSWDEMMIGYFDWIPDAM